MKAHLMLDRYSAHIIEDARRSAFVKAIFRHQKQRDAARSLRRIRRPGKHEMDDVFRKVVISERDEYLLTRDVPPTVLARCGPRPERPDIRTCLRFGKVHRASPLARCQSRQIESLLLLAAVMDQRFYRPCGEDGQQGEGEIRHSQCFQNRHLQREWQVLTAKTLGSGDAAPSALHIGAVGRGKALRQTYPCFAPLCTDRVTDASKWRPLTCGKLGDTFKDRVDNILFDFQPVNVCQGAEDKALLSDQAGKGHYGSLAVSRPSGDGRDENLQDFLSDSLLGKRPKLRLARQPSGCPAHE